MIELERSILINRSPDDVWKALADPPNHSKYVKMVDHAEWISDGAPGVGSTYHSVGKFMGRRIESTNEVCVWEPPVRYGYKSVDGGTATEVTYTLAAKDDGTQLRAHSSLGLSRLLKGVAIKILKGELEALKRYLETSHV